MIEGMAGLGKSRLISEVQQSIKRDEAISSEEKPKITNIIRSYCKLRLHKPFPERRNAAPGFYIRL